MQLLTFYVLTILGFATSLAAQEPQRSAEELASALQDKYETVRDFSANFIHIYEGGALSIQATESGVVLIKKPGMMNWNYREPNEKFFISDGNTLISYVPADNQVRISSMPTESASEPSVLFLIGRGDLSRDFVPSFTVLDDAPVGTQSLRLTPHHPETSYESLILVVDEVTLTIRQLISKDLQGGTSTFKFTDLKENIGIPDQMFSFTIPPEAHIITGNDASR